MIVHTNRVKKLVKPAIDKLNQLGAILDKEVSSGDESASIKALAAYDLARIDVVDAWFDADQGRTVYIANIKNGNKGISPEDLNYLHSVISNA